MGKLNRNLVMLCKLTWRMNVWFLFVLLFDPFQLGGAEPQNLRQLRCKNPNGKLLDSLLDKNCGMSVCKKKGNKGAWKQCPRPATQNRLQEMEETMLTALKKLEETIEDHCTMGQMQGSEGSESVKIPWKWNMQPKTYDATPGQKLIFVIKDEMEHNAYKVDNLDCDKIDPVDQGQRTDITMKAPIQQGTYYYVCKMSGHCDSGMKATVIVN